MIGVHPVKLVLPERILEDAWIRFDNCLIHSFGTRDLPAGDFADGQNLFLAAGFIDLHVHGGVGFDFLDNTAEAFETISAFHTAGGTTALCPTLATTTYGQIAAVTETYQRMRSAVAGTLLPMHLEGPHLARGKAGAQDPALLKSPSKEDIEWLVRNAASISQITVAPELPNGLELITCASQAGIRISLGHTDATEEQAKEGVNRGAVKVTHQFNAMSSAGKRGLFRQPGVAEYALTEPRLVCELIADGFHVAPTLIKMALQCKGTAGIALVSDALAGAGLPLGSIFKLGNLECRVEEGYCALRDGSALSGSAARLIDQLPVMVNRAGLSLCDAVRMATLTPATVLGIQHERGSIAAGLAADCVLFDEDFKVRKVFVAGREF